MNSWMAGSLVTSTATFVSEATGQVADPTTITLKYVAPGGTVQTVAYPNAMITRVSAGVYSAELDSTGKAGPWTVEWIGTGNVQAIAAATWTITSAVL
jgi:hypothetical protein